VASLFSDELKFPEPEKQGWWRRALRSLLRREPVARAGVCDAAHSGAGNVYGAAGLSAVFGVMCGLMLVYSIDLPQMDDLARYRPDTTTELLDIHGREIGSFALERRRVVPYTAFPPVLRQALLSIEDKTFERNWE